MGVLTVETVPLARLFPSPTNPRKNEAAVPHVAASLRRFGFQQPLVAKRSGEVIAGNTRLKAAQSLKMTEVPVVWFDGPDLEATAYAVADNKTAEFAEWDEPALAKILEHLRAEDALEGVGFDDRALDDLLAELGVGATQFDEDQAPLPMDAAVTRRGDVWLLGRHRLHCGDSADAADVDRLLAGARIQLLNTDPPYNVKVEPRSNNAIAAGLSSFGGTHHQRFDAERNPGAAKATHSQLRAKDRPLLNDFVTDEEFERLLLAWFGHAARALDDGCPFYIWGGYANVANYPPALKASNLYFSQALIWVKGHPVLTRKDFMGNHEWCFYGWKEGAAHRFYGPNNETDVWEIKKVNPQSMIHLTEKPVELAVRAIELSSRQGENVLDLFGGSGSTLIAAERAGRNAFLMELDPAYADVIVRRFEQTTGTKAVLEAGGRTFEQVADERSVS